jgi:hypothetical protein
MDRTILLKALRRCVIWLRNIFMIWGFSPASWDFTKSWLVVELILTIFESEQEFK